MEPWKRLDTPWHTAARSEVVRRIRTTLTKVPSNAKCESESATQGTSWWVSRQQWQGRAREEWKTHSGWDAATVIAGVDNARVAQHLALSGGTLDTYPKIMEAVRTLVRANRGWNVSSEGDATDDDAKTKSKGKGKKGKGKVHEKGNVWRTRATTQRTTSRTKSVSTVGPKDTWQGTARGESTMGKPRPVNIVTTWKARSTTHSNVCKKGKTSCSNSIRTTGTLWRHIACRVVRYRQWLWSVHDCEIDEQPTADVWILYDTGSAVTACPHGFQDEHGNRNDNGGLRCVAVTWNTVTLGGAREVPVEISDTNFSFHFRVASVTKPIVSAEGLFHSGCTTPSRQAGASSVSQLVYFFCVIGRGRGKATGSEKRERPWHREIGSTARSLDSLTTCLWCSRIVERRAAAVTEKGPAEAPVKIATRCLEAWGKRTVLVADGELAIQALLTAVKLARQESRDRRTTIRLQVRGCGERTPLPTESELTSCSNRVCGTVDTRYTLQGWRTERGVRRCGRRAG